ncbi:CoA transferase [Verticiella sediminum]|uniref:CoA transferase n=1 Tax=Verticiella sediminum TaxID=1247510 RepID=A0A556ACR1_9BURK|nr:CoA transferase [Verticiella sediminum]TSH90669.1 CoA transferase [Verticiella sediminum]
MTQQDFAPLAGVQVLDFSHVIAGPLATFFLTRLGAQVIKVEHPDGGDVMRNTEKGRQSFLALNAGKEELQLDLSLPAHQARARALLADCNVLVDNLRPGTLEKYGLGYDAAIAINPRLVYCAISGFGRASPAWGLRPAYDHVVQAATGMTFMAGLEGDPPIKTGFPVVDSATGLLAAFAIVAALRDVDRTGRGCLLDVSMTGAAMQLMYGFAAEALTQGTTPPRVGNQGYSGSPSADFFPAREGWIAFGANTPRQLAGLLDELGMADTLRDPAVFDPPLELTGKPTFVRAKDPAELKRRLRAAVAQEDAADLERRLIARGVPCSRLRTIAEFARDAVAEGAIETVTLTEGEMSVTTPGLGFGVRR